MRLWLLDRRMFLKVCALGAAATLLPRPAEASLRYPRHTALLDGNELWVRDRYRVGERIPFTEAPDYLVTGRAPGRYIVRSA